MEMPRRQIEGPLARLAPLSGLEKCILVGKYDKAYKQWAGDKKCKEFIQCLDQYSPYVSDKKERQLQIILIKALRQSMQIDKEKKSEDDNYKAFDNLIEAMEHFGLKNKEHDKILDEQKKKKEDDRANRLKEKEGRLLEPSIVFKPVPMNYRMGLTRGDVVCIGEAYRIKNALDDFEYLIDIFSPMEIIVRNCLILGVRSDTLVASFDKLKTNKSKYKKGDWRREFHEEKDLPKFLLDDIAIIVGRNPKFDGLVIATRKCFLYKGFWYILCLPDTVVSTTFCRQTLGKVIPMIDNWTILGTR